MPCMTYESPEEIAAREREREQELVDASTGPLLAKIDIQGRQITELEAMLCGVFYLLENGFTNRGATIYLQEILDRVNWQETGTTQMWTEDWWEDHKEQDRQRRIEEGRKRERRRREILARLTDEEQEILGL